MPDMLSIATWRSLFNRFGKGCGWIIAAMFGIPLAFTLGSNYGLTGGRHDNTARANTTIVNVNGEPITEAQFDTAFANLQRQNPVEPGQGYAEAEGQTLDQLIRQTAITQEALRRNVRASQADIDKQIAELRQRVLPKNATDSDWDDFVSTNLGVSPAAYRESLAKQLVIPAFFQDISNQIKVTPDEARNQNGSEVKLDLILVPAVNTSQSFMNMQRKPAPLPDAEAKKKAEDLLAQARGGADIAALARANSADPSSKQGGALDWKNEFQALRLYGNDFAEAVQKTPKGQFTPVFKSPGFSPGYVFAKVVDRRINLPKDFDVKKATDQIKQERASKEFSNIVTKLTDNAKVDFVDKDKKAYYDLYKYSNMEQGMMMAQFGQPQPGKVATQADVDKQKALADQEFATLATKHPDDATAALVYANILKTQRTTPDQRAKVNAQLIQLYQSALKTTENSGIRLELADLYRDTKQQDLAVKQYDTIKRLLDVSTPIGLQDMRQAKNMREQLIARFRSVNQLDDATKEQAKVAKLDTEIKEEEAKEKAAQAQQNAPMPNLTMPGGAHKTLTMPSPVPPGGKPGAAPSGSAPGTPPNVNPEPVPSGGKSEGESKTDFPDKPTAPGVPHKIGP